MGARSPITIDCSSHLLYLLSSRNPPNTTVHAESVTFPTERTPRVFFSSTLFTPFIEDDAAILSRHVTMEMQIGSGLRALMRIPGGVLRSEVTFSWFGSVYAGYTVFLARLFRKKSIIVVAGVDASKDREIHYGIWLSPWKSVIVRYAFVHADRLLVVDPFLEREAKRLARYDGGNITYIPFGFDSERWKPSGVKEDMVLTVAACHDTWRMKKKGIDKLLAAAAALPKVKFQVIGIHAHLIPSIEKTENVEFIPFVPRAELLAHYQRAKVYCQPSFTEGLPNTLCEAMLCGCIPVGTAVGGIPTAIGDAGYLVPYGDIPQLVAALNQALQAAPLMGERARRRVAGEFTLKKREENLVQVLSEVLT
jgi:glycosyltransferase involved in cell wall biosynthesis